MEEKKAKQRPWFVMRLNDVGPYCLGTEISDHGIILCDVMNKKTWPNKHSYGSPALFKLYHYNKLGWQYDILFYTALRDWIYEKLERQ